MTTAVLRACSEKLEDEGDDAGLSCLRLPRAQVRPGGSARRGGCARGLVGLLGLLLSGCSGASPTPTRQTSAEKPSLPTISAELVQIGPTRWPLIVRSQGTLASDEVTVVGVKVEGRVAEIRFDLGDEVAADDVIMSLDQQELELAVAQAEAALSQARAAVGLPPDAALASLDPMNSPPVREAQAVLDEALLKRKRMETLWRQRAITETEWEEVLAAEKVGEAQLASAVNAVNEKIALIRLRSADLAVSRQRLEESVIRSPFDAIVQQRHVSPGTYVQAGQAVVTLVRSDPLRYRGTLPERHARRLRLGQRVLVNLEAGMPPYETRVSRISPALDPASRALTFEAIIKNPDGQWRAGLFAEATVQLDPDQQALLVPETAIMEFAGTQKIWKVVNGETSEQHVLTGQRRDGFVEIVEGLQAGDLILADGDAGRRATVEPTVTLAFRSDGRGLAPLSELAAGGDSTADQESASRHAVERFPAPEESATEPETIGGP